MSRKAAPRRVRVRLSGIRLAAQNAIIDRRDQQKCARCGRIVWSGGSRHHRQFLSRGGSDVVSNRVLMCGSGTTGCHGWAHANPAAANLTGFALESWQLPTEHRIEHAILGPVWLDDDGGSAGIPPTRPFSE